MRRRTKESSKNMVGKRIHLLREQKGLSQGTFLAQLQIAGSDMSQSKLSRIEGQQIPVSDTDLFNIASVLRVSVDELFSSAKTEETQS